MDCNCLGAKDCTPEIDTSEIVVNCQWDCPMEYNYYYYCYYYCYYYYYYYY